MKIVRSPWDYWYDKRGEIKRCDKCKAPWHWDMLTNYRHDDDLCIGRQLLAAKTEIKSLKIAVDDWKDAWYKVRGILGHLWWHHPSISSEKSLQYYQNNLKKLQENKS